MADVKVPYAPSQGGFTVRPTAFAAMSNVQGTGNLNAPNIWSDQENLFYKFAFAREPLAKAQAYQNLNRALNNTAGPAGFKNQFDYISSLLVKTGLTKNSLGFASALDKVVAASVGTNTHLLSLRTITRALVVQVQKLSSQILLLAMLSKSRLLCSLRTLAMLVSTTMMLTSQHGERIHLLN